MLHRVHGQREARSFGPHEGEVRSRACRPFVHHFCAEVLPRAGGPPSEQLPERGERRRINPAEDDAAGVHERRSSRPRTICDSVTAITRAPP